MNKGLYHISAVMFVGVTLVYLLFAWDRVLEPSPQFHFTDLAHSFLEGRLDTDTPRTRGRGAEGEANGLRDAVKRATKGKDGKTIGWNDWASYFELTLRENGEVVQGVWPWKDQEGRKNEFHTLNGTIRFVDRQHDVARTCPENPRKRCIKEVYQISFPPFPAVALMPAVAVFGYRVNDVIITAVLAGLNSVLMFFWLTLLVSRGYSRADLNSRLWMTLFFAFGTAVFFSSVRGEVWFLAQIMGCTLHLLFLLAALDGKHPWLAGLALACGFATRTPLVFASLFFAFQVFLPPGGGALSFREGTKKCVQFGLPCLMVGVSLLVMNEIRWGNPTEFGHTYLAEGTRPSIRDYGLFHPHFVERNLRVMLTHFPSFSSEAPYIQISKHGLGLFIASPFLLWGLWVRKWGRLSLGLVLTSLCVFGPAVFYQNSGWEQYAFRFSIDALPLFMGLLVIQHPTLGVLAKGSIVVSVIIQGFGAVVFGRFPEIFGG
jgi:hypothetical protein